MTLSRHPDTHSRVAPLFPLPDSTGCRTPFRPRPDTVLILSDTIPIQPQNCPPAARNPVRQESEWCPAEIGTLSDRDWNHCPTEPGIRSYSYVYDSRDRLLTNCTPQGLLTYVYDPNGNVTSISSSTANGTQVAYQYDPLSRLTNVIDASLANTQNTAYGYDAVGNVQRLQYPNNVTNFYQYDSLSRLTNMVWKTSGTTIGSFSYQLGLTGNRTHLSETIGTAVSRSYLWQFDSLYRLTNEVVSGTAPTGNLGYQFDAAGNRLNRNGSLGSLGVQSLAYNTNDWLKTDAYDSNGNTLWSTNGSVQGPYQYDYENRLTSFNNGQVILVYDADGNRVQKITSTATTLYLVDTHNPTGNPQVLEELTVVGVTTNLSRAYTWGLSLISQRMPGTSTNFYGFDGHGSVRFLTGLSGGITDTYAYDAYGNLIVSTGSTPNNFLYCCCQNDPDLGLVYDNARYLKLNTGRFWTLDTSDGNNEDPLSLHKYLYCQDNPIDNDDPSGNDMGEMLAVMDLDSFLAAIISPVTSKAVAVAAPVEYKFGVVVGGRPLFHPIMDYYAFSGRWAQPMQCGSGNYTIGTDTASSWVKIKSRNAAGGSCNTVSWSGSSESSHSATIILYMRCAEPGPVKVSAVVGMDLSGSGPMGAASAKIVSQGKWLGNGDSKGGSAFHLNKLCQFDANVQKTWTPVLEFIPTVAFPKDNGTQSTGRAAGIIILSTFKK